MSPFLVVKPVKHVQPPFLMVSAPEPLSLDSRRPVEILGTAELGPADFLMIADSPRKETPYIYIDNK